MSRSQPPTRPTKGARNDLYEIRGFPLWNKSFRPFCGPEPGLGRYRIGDKITGLCLSNEGFERFELPKGNTLKIRGFPLWNKGFEGTKIALFLGGDGENPSAVAGFERFRRIVGSISLFAESRPPLPVGKGDGSAGMLGEKRKTTPLLSSGDERVKKWRSRSFFTASENGGERGRVRCLRVEK